MCNPVAIATTQFAAQTVSQAQNAKQQAKYNNRVYALNKDSAEQNALASYTQLQRRQEEEHAKAAKAIQDAHQQSTLAQGALTTSMAESNVAGNTASALTQDFARHEADYVQTVVRNQAFLDDQFKLEMKAVAIREQAQINSGERPTPLGPDWINNGIQAASQYLRMNWNSQNNQNPYG